MKSAFFNISFDPGDVELKYITFIPVQAFTLKIGLYFK